jgi:hypothetical protein
MKCFQCFAEAAFEGARFCVQCGKPLMQASPYAPQVLLPLCRANGLPPNICPETKRPLLSCKKCGRLHSLSAITCSWDKCGQSLSEASIPFPSGDGSLDGRRQVQFPESFPEVTPRLQSIPIAERAVVESTLAMAYRYGWLATLTTSGLCLRPDDSITSNPIFISFHNIPALKTSLTPTDGLRHGSRLIIDNGRAYILFGEYSLVADLPSGLALPPLLESPIRQAKSPYWWARAVNGTEGLEIRLLSTDEVLRGSNELKVRMNVPPTDVADLLIREISGQNNSADVYIATMSHGLFRWCIRNGVATTHALSLPLPTQELSRISAWNQPAHLEHGHSSEETLLVAGFDKNRNAQLMLMPTTTGNASVIIPLGTGASADFAEADGIVYVPHKEGFLICRDLRPGGQPEMVRLRAGAETVGPPMVLKDKNGEHRLLLHRRDSFGQSLILTTLRGGTSELGGTFGAFVPLVCSVNGKIIAYVQDGTANILRMFQYAQI